MAKTTRPADALTSDDDPTPRMSPFKMRYIYQPLAYFQQLCKKYADLDIGRLLELASEVQPDATQAWASGKDNDRADYLVAVEEKIQAYLTSRRPEIALRQNTWADDVLSRQRWWSPEVTLVMRNMPCGLDEAEELILAGLNKRCPPETPLRSKDDLNKFPGNKDDASGAVTDEIKIRKEQMAKTIPQWTKDHDGKLEREAGLFSILPSQIDTMVMDILHLSIRDANKEQHPDRIMATIKAGIPGWAKQWIAAPPVQAITPLGGAVEVEDEIPEEDDDDDDELTSALAANLQRLASKGTTPVVEEVSAVIPAATVNALTSKGAVALDAILGQDGETPAVEPADEKKADTETVIQFNVNHLLVGPKPTTTVDEKPEDEWPAATEPLPVLDVEGNEEFDGREYNYVAHFLTRNYRWDVIYQTYCIFSDDEKTQIQKRTADFLSLSQPDCNVSHDWRKDTPPVEIINRLREEYHKAVASAYDLPGNENERKRGDILADAFEGVVGQGAQGALQTFGYEGTMKRVHKLCIDHKNEEAAELTRKQEEDRKRFDDQQQRSLVTTSQALVPVPLVLTSPNSPIKVPSDPEMALMSKMADFAVRCKIYPNSAAAFLAIYRGFELGFSIGTSIEMIYAFEGKGGKISTMPSANAYTAIVQRSAQCEKFVVFNDSPESAVCIVKRKGEGQKEMTYTYTKEDAQKAGLLNKPAWTSNLKMMLCHRVARSTAELMFGDVCAGLGISGSGMEYEEEELPLAASF